MTQDGFKTMMWLQLCNCYTTDRPLHQHKNSEECYSQATAEAKNAIMFLISELTSM